MAVRISLAVALVLAQFRRFFRCSLGLINRLNPYAVREPYLERASYVLNNSEFLILFFEISRTVLTVDSKIEQQYKYCKF